jgi:hypothetical protein
MSIFSNRWAQGVLALGAIAFAFFTYQNITDNTSEIEIETASTTAATNTTSEATSTVDTINADGTETDVGSTVNSADKSDTINTAVEETTNQ